jgi:hypothetical protein
MKQERMHLGFAAINGRLVAAGGQADDDFMHNNVEVCQHASSECHNVSK